MDKHINEQYGCYLIEAVTDQKTKDGHKLYKVKCTGCGNYFIKSFSGLKGCAKVCPHQKEDVPKIFCKNCGKELIKKDTEKLSYFKKKKFCSQSCSVSYSNKHRKKKRFCINCGKELTKTSSVKYCSNSCQKEFYSKQKISAWRNGEWDGLTGNKWKNLSGYIRNYLFKKYNNKCSRCGWSEINPYTGTLPLEIEHIDGDADNNKEENLTLLCPNCHSLTPTYRGANKGKGKRNITLIPEKVDRDKVNQIIN